MHRLRTTVVRLRPITAPQTAKSQSQARLAAVGGALRTFQPMRSYTASVSAEPFLNGTSSNYVEEMYYAWLENPRSVHKVGDCVCVCVRVRVLVRMELLPRTMASLCSKRSGTRVMQTPRSITFGQGKHT